MTFIPGKENPRVLAGQKVEITLKDPNNKVVSSRILTTNEFGSFHGEFTLPDRGLAGSYRLSTDVMSSTYFHVEEYKRPTFKTIFLL
ncbi:MAG: MG2 domain-containing protein [Tannerellaceae bacterium]|nr:MG2 domain-containing protein [Tannerellaceae bacterium]